MPRAWEGDAATLLPGAFGAPVDRSADRGASLAYVDDTSPVFALFRGPHSGDFSSARFFRYRPLEVKDGVLARFVADGVDEAALERAKTRLIADAIYAQDSQAMLARWRTLSLSASHGVFPPGWPE